ncbi:helix-turn-helix transcriptional regulator [Baekduia alba]|uniref:helix-turn-helix transcriptional regulator n=1 Tax=Baekduia alba TaxID=2997333 RepID=UPI0023420E0D|nr:LuxR C-terminal-related transcriptional regulator [Baekduia alba]
MADVVVWSEGREHVCAALVDALARLPAGATAGIDLVAGSRAALLCDAAAPGTVLVSARARALAPDVALADLGVHRLADLSPPERLFAADPGAPPRSLGPEAATLPVFRTSFVGRAAALGEVAALAAAERLVTLAGPGGAGKTRLAAQAAAREAIRGARPDGVTWIELGGVTDPDRVVELATDATGVLVDGVLGPLRSLLAGLADRRMLICFDNAEHLVDAVAALADALLAGCPEVTVLVTSREPLDVPGEVVWRVPALEVDEAVALFVTRGAEVRGPDLAPPSADAVRSLCARLDGIPLALELAAAWLRTLSPEQIEAGLDDRFALLTRGPRGAVARQATLAASMAWSHDLLAERERVVLRRLSVFAGAFDADAAVAVCGGDEGAGPGALAALGRLVDQSLVAPADRAGRLRLLESVREYAGARLREAGEEAVTRGRHLAHLLAAARAAAPLLDTDRDAWRARLVDRQDDLRAALAWGLRDDQDGDPTPGRELAAELPWLWHITGHGHEGIATLGRAIARRPHERSLLQARLLVGVALVSDTADPLDLEYDAAQRGLELATEHGDDRLRALCLLLSGVGLLYTDLKGSRVAADDAARLGEATGDAFVAHAAVVLQGILMHLRDEHAEADALLERGSAGLLALGERGVASTALSVRAGGTLLCGDLDGARALARQAVAVAEPLAEAHRVGAACSALALVELAAGDVAMARAALAPVVRLVDRGANALFVPGLARARGLLALHDGDAGEALRWLASETRMPGGAPDTYLAAAALPALAAVQAALGRTADAHATAARALSDGRAIDLPRVVADAFEQQGWLALDAGDEDKAIALHQQALGVRIEHGLRAPAVDSLEALGVLCAATDRPDMAARALRAAAAARAASGIVGPPLRRPPSDVDAGTDVGDEPALPLDDALAYVRRAWGPRRRPGAGWGSLTPTEVEVVRLAVEGLSNPEIGAKLYMSRSTVKTHLSHVFAKVGVANRTELAAAAPEHLHRDRAR